MARRILGTGSFSLYDRSACVSAVGIGSAHEPSTRFLQVLCLFAGIEGKSAEPA